MKDINVVIADDHPLFRKGLKSLIDDFKGIHVIAVAGNGAELLDILGNENILPEIVIMDLNMPGINGIEATEKLQINYPSIKIIVLSIYTDEQFVVQLIRKGASGYLFKNAEPEEVEQAIRDVVETGFYFNNKILSAIKKGIHFKNTQPHFSKLNIDISSRELEILKLICKELTDPEIAGQLFISARTVNGHRQKLLDKTGARNAAGLVIFAIKNHLIDIGFASK